MKLFKNADVLTADGKIIKTNVSFGGRITEIGRGAEGEEIALPEGALVLPAFIDIHVHGACGADFMDGTAEALRKIDAALAAEGTSRYLATTMTQSTEKICKALSAAADFYGGDNGLSGVHLEGPFISPGRAGAQPRQYAVSSDPVLFGKFDKAARGIIRTVTLAPELDGAYGFIKYLAAKGISVSLGHTDASYVQVCRARECGADRITHTYNAQSGLHHRDIGVVGAALSDDGLYTEIIADGVHVSLPAIKLLLKCKGEDKVIAITDSIRAKGLDGGESELGGQKVFVKDGQARLADGTLAGSVLKMNRAVGLFVKELGVPVESAVRFASANPARCIGLKDCGSIAVGNRADFAVTDRNFDVIYTVRDGEIIYKQS